MSYEFRLRRRVEFSDTDMAGIVHFSAFCKYLEAAEHAFFRALGFSIVTEIEGQKYGWPRVHVELDFSAPLRFEEEFEIHLIVREVKAKAVLYEFVLARPEEAGGQRIARARMTTVCVTRRPDGTMAASPIPAALAARLRPAPAELLATLQLT